MGKTTQTRRTLRSDALRAIEACAGWNSRLASRRITQFLEKRMIGSGLTIAQFGLMAQIAAADDDTLGSLAERLGFDQSSLSRNLHALERDGMVEIAIVERDQRRRAVWLTEKGARRLEAAMPIWRSAHAALAEVLEPELARRLAIASEPLGRG
jgi:DNA-binding MarR family transcriptional regulator